MHFNGLHAQIDGLVAGAPGFHIPVDQVTELDPQLMEALAALVASEDDSAVMTRDIQARLEQERLAIAREIHDDIGGALAALRMDLSWLLRHASHVEGVVDRVSSGITMLNQTTDSIQRIMLDLRPPHLELGLPMALQTLCAQFEKRSGIQTMLTVQGSTELCGPCVELVGYRTVQESLTNISKHALATQVQVACVTDSHALLIEISDNGQGIFKNSSATSGGLGILGLRERAESVNGVLDIESDSEGTLVKLKVPLGTT